MALEEAQEVNVKKAQLLEQNLDLVDNAIFIIRSALARSMHWDEIKELIKQEKMNNNPVAKIIDELKFETNQIVVVLQEQWDYESDEDYDSSASEDEAEQKSKLKKLSKEVPKEKQKGLKISIDIGLNAHTNAQVYYDIRRNSMAKQQKTIEASAKVHSPSFLPLFFFFLLFRRFHGLFYILCC